MVRSYLRTVAYSAAEIAAGDPACAETLGDYGDIPNKARPGSAMWLTAGFGSAGPLIVRYLSGLRGSSLVWGPWFPGRWAVVLALTGTVAHPHHVRTGSLSGLRVHKWDFAG